MLTTSFGMAFARGNRLPLLLCIVASLVSSTLPEAVRRPIVLARHSVNTRLGLCDPGNSASCSHGYAKTEHLKFYGCDHDESDDATPSASEDRWNGDTRNGVRRLANLPSGSTQTSHPFRASHFLIQFTETDAQPRREDIRDRLFEDIRTVGGKILNYVPFDSYLVLLPCTKAAHALSRLSYVSWIGRLRGESKLAPAWDPILRHYKTSDNIKEGSHLYDMIDMDKEGRPMITVVLPDEGSERSSRLYASFIHNHLCEKFGPSLQSHSESSLPDTSLDSPASSPTLNQSDLEARQHPNPLENRVTNPLQRLLKAPEDSYCSTFSVSLEGISTTTKEVSTSNHDDTSGASTTGSSTSDNADSTTDSTTDRTSESKTADNTQSHQREITRQNLLTVAAPAPLVPAVLGWLQQHGWVQWLAPRPRSRLHNRWASAVTQSGSTTALDQDPGFGGTTGSGSDSKTGSDGDSRRDGRRRSGFGATWPLWEAGITGSGQIVGVSDTGIDMQSCFFRDDSVPAPGPTHRKVVLYRVVNGDTVDEQGHGTHVAGSVAGSCSQQQAGGSGSSNMTLYPGMAPDARIAFTDMGEGDEGYLAPPDDLGYGVFGQAMKAGAFIHSDSWAATVFAYDYMCQSVDRFAFNNPNFLPIIAAGNRGAQRRDGVTISSPALAKNALTVGATLNAPGSAPSLLGTALNLSIVAPNPSLLPSDLSWYPLLSHSFGVTFQPDQWEGGVRGLVRGEPRDGCRAVKGGSGRKGGSVAGMVVLLDAGNCLFADKFRNAQAAGAAAAVIVANDSQGYFPMAAPFGADPSITIPGGSVPQAMGDVLDAALSKGQR